ncbi:DUF1015 domain-containing protein [Candidatus Allofournierella excrementigallinarum]|uniref:DUF1015 domain-containing protein n=1 Tax=Candidatus Allofournierella excrementigallinarum TaxID=2838592 RepID=UPI00374E3FD4
MEPCFVPGRILLPNEDIPVSQWACLACDQFTSQPDYWEQAAALAAGGPSALNIVLPEVYLDRVDTPARIRAIHAAMERYRAEVLTRSVNGFVYVERTQTDGRVRQGLVGLIDLEQYDWRCGERPAVRPTEGTVPSRIPPRLAVRSGACLESPHILMLADDAGCTLVEPVAAQKGRLPLLYEGELALGGGFVRGWAVEDPALLAGVEKALAALGSQAAFDEKYPGAAGDAPLTLAVGDGNHSLATAKAYWEALKAELPEAGRAAHPARWCLAEVCNLHSGAIGFEPIHRVVFGVPGLQLLARLKEWCAARGIAVDGDEAPGGQAVTLVHGAWRRAVRLAGSPEPLAVGTVEAFLADYLKRNPASSVDYIHGEDAVAGLCEEGNTGILLPPFRKGDLFRGVVLGGALPRKTFSMGRARDKRYYLECRAIL